MRARPSRHSGFSCTVNVVPFGWPGANVDPAMPLGAEDKFTSPRDVIVDWTDRHATTCADPGKVYLRERTHSAPPHARERARVMDRVGA